MERVGIVEVGFGFVLQAAPADQGGLGFAQHALRKGDAPKPLRSTGPFMAGEGIDVGCGGSLGYGDLAHGLGGIHEQIGVAGMALQ